MDFAGGRLKLKGSRVTKKQKKKQKSKVTTTMADEGTKQSTANGNNNNKTEAERRFEQRQREKMDEEVRHKATTTHKDRVAEFNRKLEAMSEHHDIPKVGPG